MTYIYDAMLVSGNMNREAFNYWKEKNFVRLKSSRKVKIGEVIGTSRSNLKYEVVAFSYHRASETEAVTDIIKLQLLA